MAEVTKLPTLRQERRSAVGTGFFVMEVPAPDYEPSP